MSLSQPETDTTLLSIDDLLSFGDSRYLLSELYLAPPRDGETRALIDFGYEAVKGVVQEGRSLVMKADLDADQYEADYYLTPDDIKEFCQWTGSLGVTSARYSRPGTFDPWPSAPDMP